jgi:hypothetical protein
VHVPSPKIRLDPGDQARDLTTACLDDQHAQRRLGGIYRDHSAPGGGEIQGTPRRSTCQIGYRACWQAQGAGLNGERMGFKRRLETTPVPGVPSFTIPVSHALIVIDHPLLAR